MSIENILIAIIYIIFCASTLFFLGAAILNFYRLLQVNTNRSTNIVPLLLLLPNSHHGEAKEKYLKFVKFFVMGGIAFLGAVVINFLFL
jgi:hypothetical protein